VVFNRPGVVRFAAGSETGRRSHTWRVEGVSNSSGRDDIYVGTRQTMNVVKVSLHDANPAEGWAPATNLAFTTEFAKDKQLVSRLLAKMKQTAPLAPGWRHELTIATPTTTFGTFTETPPLRQGEVIQWWTPPPSPEQLCFHLYVGDANYPPPRLGNHVGDVCQMQLTHGRRLWIVAVTEAMPDSVGQSIQQHLANLSQQPNAVHPFTLLKHDDRVPVVLDLATLA
jgi:hypothetical protein